MKENKRSENERNENDEKTSDGFDFIVYACAHCTHAHTFLLFYYPLD